MKRKLGIVTTWLLLSLLLQIILFNYINLKVSKYLPTVESSISKIKEFTILGNDLENLKFSYAKDYVAFKENELLTIYNLKMEKVIFKKIIPSNNNLLFYQWLPDRNTLIYFYSNKGPTIKQNFIKTQIGKTDLAGNTQSLSEPRLGNTEVVELYSLELSDSSEDIKPNDRYNLSINNFPIDGIIREMTVSTYNNTIYLIVETPSKTQLLEIDEMKNVNYLNFNGNNDFITNLTISNKYGTLYIEI